MPGAEYVIRECAYLLPVHATGQQVKLEYMRQSARL